MSPRRNRRVPRGTGPPRPAIEPTQEWRGLPHVVRPVAGAAATKPYRCPGCDQEIRPGTPHVVAWAVGDEDGRRHWHTPCWRARHRRGGRA